MGKAEVSQQHRKLVCNQKGTERRDIWDVEQDVEGRVVGILKESRHSPILEPWGAECQSVRTGKLWFSQVRFSFFFFHFFFLRQGTT